MNRILLTIFMLIMPLMMLARHYDLSAVRLSTADGLPTNIVNRIWQDSIGYIKIETANGLCRYDGYNVVQVDDSVRRVSPRSLQLRTREAEWVRIAPGRLERRDISITSHRLPHILKKQWQLIPEDVIAHTRNDHFHVADVDSRTEAISTYGGGLFLYDKPTGELTQVNSGVIDNPYLTGLFVDQTGCIWVIEDYLGVKCLQTGLLSYQRHLINNNTKIREANYIRSMTADNDGSLLVGTQDGKLYRYDNGSHRYMLLQTFTHRVYAAYRSRKGQLWVGTRGGGLFCDGQKVSGLPSNDIYNICEDGDGSLWVAMLHGGVARIGKNGIKSYLKGKDCHDLLKDYNGRWWIATEDSLYTIFHGKVTAMAAGYFVCLCIDKVGHVWGGSIGSGLMNCHTKKRYTLANNNVYCVTVDKRGRIWAGTEEGLSCIDLTTSSIENHTFTESPLVNVFNERMALCMKDGSLVFGTHDGLIEIEGGIQQAEARLPKTVFTSLYVNGNQCDLLTQSSFLTPLSHTDNNLTFSFSNFQYANQQSVLYQYSLDGYDREWSVPSREHTATYRHLSPGKYTFRVRSCVNGRWGEAACLNIRILQPWWNTWWVWLLYIIILISTVWTIFTVTRRQVRLRRQIDVQRQVNAFQRDFYDRIERELRTPLNMVQGAAENVVLSGTTKTTVQSLRRGSRRVAKLMEMIRKFHDINELEMQRKAEEETMNEEAELRFKDIQQTIREDEQEFRELAPPPINDQSVLLVVTDNDSRAHLRDIINPYFRVNDIAAFEQINLALENCLSDIVLMDITSNERAAMEQTRRLSEKNSPIPVIHLSSFNDNQHQLRSLRSGAADYITLPVSNKVLIERLTNVLRRGTVQTNYAEQTQMFTDTKEKKFLDQMQASLIAHVTDDNFSVEQWAELMGLGRTQFYKKVKTLTGETPMTHLQRERLNHAANLLRNTHLTVEEVMLRAGYHNATHFYNSFKKNFGMSPSDMRKN